MEDKVQAPQVWQVTVGGKSVNVQSLPLREVDRIAKDTGVTWFAVVNSPLTDLLVAGEVVAAAAAHLGVDAPQDLTPRTIVDLFTLVPDDVPEMDREPTPDPLDRSGAQSATPG